MYQIGKPSASERAQRVREKLNNRFGTSLFVQFSNEEPLSPFISTGLESLDRALNGGFPRGSVIECFGEAGTGKTSFALLCIASLQRQGRLAAFIDAERTVTRHDLVRSGIDAPRLPILYPSTGEDVVCLCERLTQLKTLDLIVIDSIPTLLRADSERFDLTPENVAQDCRFQYRLVTRLEELAKRRQLVILMINHESTSSDLAIGSSQGSMTLKLRSAVRLRLESFRRCCDQEGRTIGQRVDIRVIRAPHMPYQALCPFPIRYSQQ